MRDERRYSDEEVAKILDEATRARGETGSSLSSLEGFTLEELKAIGGEAGIDPRMIERAARELDRPLPEVSADVRLLGARVGVGRSVQLPRRLTDEEWNRLVVDLRETFDAKGKIETDGAFRQWRNGQLQALLEPTAEGERLRLKTVKSQGRMFLSFGAVMLVVLTLRALVAILFGDGLSADSDFLTLAVLGGGMMASQYLLLPPWARKRALQMEGVARRLIESVGEERGERAGWSDEGA